MYTAYKKSAGQSQALFWSHKMISDGILGKITL